MKYVNIKHLDQAVSFSQATALGLGRDGGLFFPQSIPRLDNIRSVLEMDFVDRSVEILAHFVDQAVSRESLAIMLDRAFNFPIKVKRVEPDTYAVELFHGPSLAFKDFGARFLAECLGHLSSRPTTILTATSGDTGAAVAHAFYARPNVRVVILYPEGRISQLQEKLFCTLGGNITVLAVNSDFDDCQKLVKQAFDDRQIRETIWLNSANSINICRLLAQVCYYFEAVSQLPKSSEIVVSVPSGNFGNLTAGLIARAMGLPIKRFVAATNVNDTVPRFLATNRWEPDATLATLTNAMDVSVPNNFPRVQWLSKHFGQTLGQVVKSVSISDSDTSRFMKSLFDIGYTAEPHTALACAALKRFLGPGEQGMFLGTAHPAKFKNILEQVIGIGVELPRPLQKVANRPLLIKRLQPDFAQLKQVLLASDDR